jgi:hypothetical protein
MSRDNKIFGGMALVASLALSTAALTALAQQKGGMKMGRQGQHVSKPMMMRTQMLMSMHVDPMDPNAVLALKNDLKLTDDQVQRLHDISGAAHGKVRKVLTEDQQSELEALQTTPDNAMDMHKMMMSKRQGGQGMGGMHHTGGKGASDNCPMFGMMNNMHDHP